MAWASISLGIAVTGLGACSFHRSTLEERSIDEERGRLVASRPMTTSEALQPQRERARRNESRSLWASAGGTALIVAGAIASLLSRRRSPILDARR